MVGVGGAHNREIGDRSHDPEIFEAVVTGAVEPHRHSGVVSDHSHRHSCVGAVGADLLATQQRSECGERGRIGDEAAGCHSGRNGHHVLLGDADVEEPLRMAFGEVGDAVGFGEIGGENHDPLVIVGDVRQLLTEHECRRGCGIVPGRRSSVAQQCAAAGGTSEDLALVLRPGRGHASTPSGSAINSAITSS